MTKFKTLEAIKGTNYVVIVRRDDSGVYTVEVSKPAATNEPYVTYEIVALQYLDGTATEYELNRLVQRVIKNDQISLVGEYKDYEEEQNGN